MPHAAGDQLSSDEPLEESLEENPVPSSEEHEQARDPPLASRQPLEPVVESPVIAPQPNGGSQDASVPGSEPLRLDLSESQKNDDRRQSKIMYPPPLSPNRLEEHSGQPLTITPNSSSGKRHSFRSSKSMRWSWQPSRRDTLDATVARRASRYRRSSVARRPLSSGSSSTSSEAMPNSPATVQSSDVANGNSTAAKELSNLQQQDPQYLRFMSSAAKRETKQRRPEAERHAGYAGLVAHMTKTQNVVIRRFDNIHVRLLLYLQDQIARAESYLGDLDDSVVVDRAADAGSRQQDLNQERVVLMEQLRILIGEYDAIISTFSNMQAAPASDKAVAKLKQWTKKHHRGSITGHRLVQNGAPSAQEVGWLEQANDLTSLSVTPAWVPRIDELPSTPVPRTAASGAVHDTAPVDLHSVDDHGDGPSAAPTADTSAGSVVVPPTTAGAARASPTPPASQDGSSTHESRPLKRHSTLRRFLTVRHK